MKILKLVCALMFVLTATQAYAVKLELDSTSFTDQSTLNASFTCDGKNISPALEWKNISPQTESFALILSDPDAPGGTFYHWVLFNLPKTMTSLPAGVTKLPPNAITGKNSWGRMQYHGPCPPVGSTHHYIFRLYALNSTLNLTEDADANAVMAATKNQIVGEAELRAVYGH